MAETMYFQWQNEALLDLTHLWGKMKMHGFRVHYNGKVDLLEKYRKQIWNRV